MKAITYTNYGGPEVLHLVDDAPEPKIGPAEVRIAVRASSVNPVDWKVVAGGLDPMMDTVFPAVPGWDVAGVVEELGLDAGEFAVGDEVMAYARKDVVHGGALAEKMTVPLRTLARKPASLTWEEAAALPLAGLTAYQSLTRLDVTNADTVLVHAAAGGVGSFAVQIARSMGARVIGTASQRNHDYLRALGAEPVEYGDGLPARVRALAPEGVSVVVDYAGEALHDTLAVLAAGGRHASIADPSVGEHGGLYLWVRPDAQDLDALAQLVDEGELGVTVAETYPLASAADAYRANMEGHTRGKIAIRISD